MRKLIVLLFILSACAPVGYDATLTANAPAETPTQEIWTPVPTANMWRVDCMTPAQQQAVVNINPCLSGIVQENHYGTDQVRPLQYQLAFRRGQNNTYEPMDIWFDGGFVFNATYWSGSAGFSMSGVEVDNSCHLILVHGDSTINVSDANGNGIGDDEEAASGNFFVSVVIYDDNGNVHTIDDPIAEVWYDGFQQPHYRLARQGIEIPFPFYFENPTTIQVDVMFRAIWGTGNHGSTFRIRDIILLRVDAGHCAGITGF